MKNSTLFLLTLIVFSSFRAKGQSTLTFTPSTGGIGWYRITTLGAQQGGRVTISTGYYDNTIADIEFQYDIGGYGVGGSIQQTRFSSYNLGCVDQLRISSDGSANTYLDIHVRTATAPTAIAIVGYGPNMPSFVSSPVVGATAGSTDVNVLTLSHGFNTTKGATFAQTGGNVGIGTTAPYYKLAVNGQIGTVTADFNASTSTGSALLMETGATTGNTYSILQGQSYGGAATSNLILNPTGGNVGIGTTTPSTILDIQKQYNYAVGLEEAPALNFTTNNGFTFWSLGQISSYVDAGSGNSNSNYPGGLLFKTKNPDGSYSSAPTTKMCIDAYGSVGIGTTDPKGYKLAVNGDAIATSMTVKLYTDWPDYVFKSTYKLPTLSTVKTYIELNHHLPDMPAESEIVKTGLNLGSMEKTLTKKVEELTLYLIEKDKQLDEQKKTDQSFKTQLDTQKKTNQSLQQQLSELKQQISQLSSGKKLQLNINP